MYKHTKTEMYEINKNSYYFKIIQKILKLFKIIVKNRKNNIYKIYNFKLKYSFNLQKLKLQYFNEYFNFSFQYINFFYIKNLY